MPPHRPQLSPWHRVAPNRDRLLLEHAGECVTFEGRAVTGLLPALLPLLDGTRTIRELVEALELPDPAPVDHALALLHEHGLLVEGPPLDAAVPAPFRQTARFLAAGPRGRSPAAERSRLAGARIAVHGAGSVAGETARLLLASGVGDVARRPVDEGLTAGIPDLVVLAPSPSEQVQLRAWNERALEHGVEWLQVLPWDGAAVVVGPVFVPGETCCWECYRRRRRSHLDYGDESIALDRVPTRAPCPPGLVAAVAGMATLLALRRLLGDPLLAGAAAVLELGESSRLDIHPVLRVPRCPACSYGARTARPMPWAEPS